MKTPQSANGYLSLFMLLFVFLFVFQSCNKDSDLFDNAIDSEIAKNTEEAMEIPGEEGSNPLSDNEVSTELKAFPSAFGAGATASGGRGGQVLFVENLNDNGPGSLREALMTEGPRIIVFRVSGIIRLQSRIYVNGQEYGNFTLAGQTAPAGGITIAGSRVVFSDMDNIIVRHIRFKGGQDSKEFQNSGNPDSFTGSRLTNAIWDHCTFAFGGDEAFSMGLYQESEVEVVDNITIQKCLIAESKTGSIFGGSEPNEKGSGDWTIWRNAWYNITHRHPNLGGGGRFDVINNVSWGWRWRIIRANEGVELNHINNFHYFAEQNSFGSLDNSESRTGQGNKWRSDLQDVTASDFSLYTFGNVYKGNPSFSYTDENGYIYDGSEESNFWTWRLYDSNNDISARQGDAISSRYEVLTQKPILGIAPEILGAEEAFFQVANDVGCNKRIGSDGSVYSNYDMYDQEYVGAMQTQNYINRRLEIERSVASNSTESNVWRDDYDTDLDGMADAWEVANYGDLSTSSGDDTDGDGYTNLEEFLNLVDLITN